MPGRLRLPRRWGLPRALFVGCPAWRRRLVSRRLRRRAAILHCAGWRGRNEPWGDVDRRGRHPRTCRLLDRWAAHLGRIPRHVLRWVRWCLMGCRLNSSQLGASIHRLRWQNRCDARQNLRVDLRGADIVFLRLEPRDQADLAHRPPHFIPGNPDAVRMPDFRLAVVLGQLLFGKDVLAVGRAVRPVALGVVEREHGELAFDLDGLVRATFVEHHTTTEAAYARATGTIQDRVRPHGDHAIGLARLVVARPWNCPAEVETIGDRAR